MKIQENVSLKPYTYFKIGGAAKFFTEVKNEEELREAVKFAKAEDIPFFVLGAASNVLVSDKGFPGLVIRMLLRDIRCDGIEVWAGSGVPNALLVARLLKEGLAGFEWAIGIPGTVGGSVRGNAGCFSGEMQDVLKRVRYFNSETGETEEGDNAFCAFSYRDSIFKQNPRYVIMGATLGLRKGNPELSQRLVRYYTSLRTGSQDIGSSSAGCVFKNVRWPSDDRTKKRLLRMVPELAEFSQRDTVPVGFLIDHSGLKGRRIGDVSISQKHGNYFINNGGSSSEDVVMLIGLVKEYIHRKFGFLIEEEIQYVGF